MSECTLKCGGAGLQAAALATLLEHCSQGTVQIQECSVDADALAPLRDGAHAGVSLSLQGVRGKVDLHGVQLHELRILASTTDQIDLHDGVIDRVRIAPSADPMPDAYVAGAPAPALVHAGTIEARGCRATNFAVLAMDVADEVDLKHARIEDTLDLTFTHTGSATLRFATVGRLEAARLGTTKPLDLFGVHVTQASLAGADLASVDAQTATVDDQLSLRATTIHGQLDASWSQVGAIVFNGTRVKTMDLGYAHLGLLDVDSSLSLQAGAVTATGLHVDSIGGDVQVLTQGIVPSADAQGAFHSLETALRSGGRYPEANVVAFQGSPLTATIAAKLPATGALLVMGLLAVCFIVAARCCRPIANDDEQRWKLLLCALDIVLPSFVDIGALSAWTDYDDASKKDAEVRIEGRYRTAAFIVRVIGTMAFGYLLLYVANLRG